MTHINSETGIRFGIISANRLDPEVVSDLIWVGVDLSWEMYCADVRIARHLPNYADIPDEDAEVYEEYESEVRGVTAEGVHFETLWLGGALNFVITMSPFVTKHATVGSPCVPGMGVLDDLDGDVICYDVPPGWRDDREAGPG